MRSRFAATPLTFRLLEVERDIATCRERYFATLTSRRRHDSISLSGEVSKTLCRVNTRLYRRAFTHRREVRIHTFTVQEMSENEGLHAHILIGVPNDSLEQKAHPYAHPISQLLTQTWVGLDPEARSPQAQDVQPIYAFDGVCAYVSKTISELIDLDRVDYLNTISF